jgi:hypothetical protein
MAKKIKKITDKMRLDWLIKTGKSVYTFSKPKMFMIMNVFGEYKTARQAIDSAIRKGR